MSFRSDPFWVPAWLLFLHWVSRRSPHSLETTALLTSSFGGSVTSARLEISRKRRREAPTLAIFWRNKTLLLRFRAFCCGTRSSCLPSPIFNKDNPTKICFLNDEAHDKHQFQPSGLCSLLDNPVSLTNGHLIATHWKLNTVSFWGVWRLEFAVEAPAVNSHTSLPPSLHLLPSRH